MEIYKVSSKKSKNNHTIPFKPVSATYVKGFAKVNLLANFEEKELQNKDSVSKLKYQFNS